MSKGRFDEAEKIIRDVARVNKATLPETLFERTWETGGYNRCVIIFVLVFH